MRRIEFVMTAVVLAALCMFAEAKALTLEEVLARHVEALGGIERLRQVNSSYIVASLSMGGMEGKSVGYYKAPDKVRVELSLPILNYMMVCDGDDCWMTDQQGLTNTLQADLRSSMRSQMILERWLYLEPDKFDGEIKLTGDDVLIDSVPCYRIDIEPTDGSPVSLYLDREGYLPVQVSLITDMADVHTKYFDYRPVDGIMLPFRASERTGAALIEMNMSIDTVMLNVEIPDSLFQRPAAVMAPSALEDSLVVPFEPHENHLYIQVMIDGKGPFDFIFDSGAAGIAINSRLLKELQLPFVGVQEARGVGGADSAAIYLIDELAVGAVELDSLSAFGVDLGELDKVSGRAIDGAIGYDLLSRYVVTVDYDNDRLIFYDPNISLRDSWGKRCDLILDFRLPYLRATVNDSIPGIFRLDTGSRSSLDFNSPFVKAHALLDTAGQRYATTRLIGLGGTLVNIVSRLSSFEMCEARVDNLFVSFSTTESGLFAGRSTAGNIGGGILEGFTVTFDYGREAVYFKKGERFARIGNVHNMAGLVLAARDDSVSVVEVFPDGPAAEVLQESDVIVRVDGRDVNGLPVEDINWMLIGERGTKVTVEVMRNGAWLKKKLELQNFY